jgi:glycosyltransferase involved in cell wall biosynthesis
MAELRNLVILSPFGVFPPRSGGHAAVLEPARALARSGVTVHLFGLGIRRFEAFRHLRSFTRQLEPRLTEERHVSPWNWIDYLRRRRTGLPPLGAGAFLSRRASPQLRERMATADAVLCELPWLFAAAPPERPRVLLAQNVEAALVEENPHAGEARRAGAAQQEGRAWTQADAVICLTEADRDELARRYGNRPATVVPLGVDADRLRPGSPEARAGARRTLGVGERFVVLFTGAWHPPNRAARDRVLGWADRLGEDFLLVVAGSVGDRPARGRNWLVTGTVPDLAPWFHACDCCVNPVTEGSGANVKMLEYLAYGLPVVTTAFGARGLEEARDGEHLIVCAPGEFPAALGALSTDPEKRRRLGTAGRAWVEAERSWAALAARRREVIESVL